MELFKRGRVNIVITNRHLRYTDHSNRSLDSLTDHGEVELPENTIIDGKIENRKTLQDIMSDLVKEKKWRRNKLFFAVPDDTVVIRELQVPVSLTEDEALSYVRMQLGKSFYLPFSNPAIDIDMLEAEKEKRNLLIYAYPKEQVMAFQEMFEEAGLKPVVADLTALSVYRYYYKKHQAEKSHVLLLHWNKDALVITAFNQHKAVFSRYLKYSTRLGEKNNFSELNEVKAEEIIDDLIIEINRILDFYHYSITEGESAITRLLLSGDFPYIELVEEKIKVAIDIPIYDYEADEAGLELPIKYVDVLGLALKKEG